MKVTMKVYLAVKVGSNIKVFTDIRDKYQVHYTEAEARNDDIVNIILVMIVKALMQLCDINLCCMPKQHVKQTQCH